MCVYVWMFLYVVLSADGAGTGAFLHRKVSGRNPTSSSYFGFGFFPRTLSPSLFYIIDFGWSPVVDNVTLFIIQYTLVFYVSVYDSSFPLFPNVHMLNYMLLSLQVCMLSTYL